MKWKGRWAALAMTALIIVTALLTGCGSEQDESEATRPLMLWEVTDQDGHTLYLAGTIHLGDETMIPPAAPYTEALDRADALAVEADLLAYEADTALQLKLSYEYGVYQDGTNVQDHISPELYRQAKEILEEYSQYQPACELLTVGQWAALLQELAYQQSGYSRQYGLDRYFLQQAKEENKPVYEVESAESQMALSAQYSDELASYILESSLDLDAGAQALRDTVDAWQQGDLIRLSDASATTGELTETEAVLVEEYLDILLYGRNPGMVKKAKSYLTSGETVFVAVGATHMAGETGLVHQLEEIGCTVRRLDVGGNYIAEADKTDEGAEPVSSAA